MLTPMPAPAVLKKPATYDDLLQVPDHLVAEILGGELYATPRPSLRHARTASVLGVEIGGRSTPVGVGLEGGGLSTNPNCICATISSFPTWPAGAAIAFQRFLTPLR